MLQMQQQNCNRQTNCCRWCEKITYQTKNRTEANDNLSLLGLRNSNK